MAEEAVCTYSSDAAQATCDTKLQTAPPDTIRVFKPKTGSLDSDVP